MKSTVLFVSVAIIIFPVCVLAGRFNNDLSFQGYTGLLSTPNAEVTGDGEMHIQFSNQLEQHRRHLDGAENYMFSIGILPNIEIGGRLTEERPSYPDGGMRDMSGNLKVRIPRFFENPYIPDLAFGLQDVAGGSSNLQTKYAVLTETINSFRFSLGYGDGPDRMEGFFGGAEIRVCDWLCLLGEYDAEETNLGFRMATPYDLFSVPISAGFSGKTSLDYNEGDFDFAFFLKFPLGFGDQAEERESGRIEKSVEQTEEPIPAEDESKQPPVPVDLDDLPAIKAELIDLGFENIRMGVTENNGLYIEYENNRYNHNELDGLGVLMGTLAKTAPPCIRHVIIVIKEIDIPMYRLGTPADRLRAFMRGEISETAFSGELEIAPASSGDPEGVSFVGEKGNPSRFKARLAFYPGVRTFIGTELDLFDVLLSIRPDARIHLWKGGVLGAIWDLPFYWTENFKDGEPFSYYRNDSQLDRLMFHQAFKLTPEIMTMFSIGMLYKDNNGVLNETMWNPGEGNHRVRLKFGKFRQKDTDIDTEVWLGSYRYFYEGLDLALEATYGQFWYQDKGFILKTRRYFNDTGITVFYRHTGTDTGERAVGVAFSFPFTPGRDMKPDVVQIRGIDRWTYEQQTTLAEEGEANPINPGLAIVPNTAHSLERSFYNHDRMNELYIRNNLQRLREAYLRWE